MVAAAVAKFGSLDILVNNAGIEAAAVAAEGYSRSAVGPRARRST